jgi:hypothetical protein
VTLQEGDDELVDAPGRRAAEDPQRDGPTAQRRQVLDAVGGLLRRAQRADSVISEDAAGVRG